MDTLETEIPIESEHGGNWERLVCSYGIQPHQILDFSVNTNPLGTPEIVEEILQRSIQEIGRYPSASPEKLCESLSQYHSIARENVTAGNGSIELIYAFARLFRSPRALLLSPTFTEYERAVNATGGTVTHCVSEEEQNFQHAFSLNTFQNIEMVFLCNPNNPTGTLYPKWKIEDWIKSFQNKSPETFFVIDESFLPFVQNEERHSLIPFAARKERVLVLRSLTKILAVPGLRLGYAVSHARTISQLEKMLPPWRINIFAQRLGENMHQFRDFIQKTNHSIYLFSKDFRNDLNTLHSITTVPSSCNFILVKLAEKRLNASKVWDRLARRGILVRACNDFKGLEQDRFLRFAVRKPQENQILIFGLKEILSDGC